MSPTKAVAGSPKCCWSSTRPPGKTVWPRPAQFGEATEVTGVVLTKLDGSAKGGIVFAIETELGLPVKLVGLGETIGDLVEFEPTEFIGALFAE